MKNILQLTILLLITLPFISCKRTQLSPQGTPLYEWEANRKQMLETDDLVLLYSGGAHRDYGNWESDLVNTYLSYVDKEGKEHWLFDGFLFLEIFDLVNHHKYATGYKGEAALKKEWKAVLDHYFANDKCIDAINNEIDVIKKRIGNPDHKHRIVISIPEPIAEVSNWGEIDGETVNLTLGKEQQMKAVKWYIDYARQRFDEADFKNVELAGFYWVAEHDSETRHLLNDVGAYLNDLGYGFNWIPYWNAPGAKDWQSLGFNFSYQQPNHFFHEDLPYSRLEDACKFAIEHNLDMELECDERGLVDNRNMGYRLRDYMKAFREFGITEKQRIAYYQGGKTIHMLKKSENELDVQLYHDFCEFVLEHSANMQAKRKK